jgi:hypothetical protein
MFLIVIPAQPDLRRNDETWKVFVKSRFRPAGVLPT